MRYNFSLKLILHLACLVLLMSALGCGLGNSKVDYFLDGYEESVEQWEAELEIVGVFTSSDLKRVGEEKAKMELQVEELETEPSSEQLDRLEKLGERMELVAEEIRSNISLEKD